MPTPLSPSIFVNLCKVANDTFERILPSSTRALRQTFADYNRDLRGTGAAGRKAAVQAAVAALAADKRRKYALALDYVSFCLDEPHALAYTTVASPMNATVSRGATRCLVFRPGSNAAPAAPPRVDPRGSDATAVRQLAVKAVRITRAILFRGTLNNEVRIGGRWLYYCCRDALPQAEKQAPKYLYDYSDRMFDDLRGANEQDIARQMAAVAYGPWKMGGAVCRMCSHVAAGVLSMLAPSGTRVAVVFDGSFDHSYAVVQRGTSPWITCDPWPGETLALTWAAGVCCFPPLAVTACYEFTVESPVSIPYGVAFADDVVAHATAHARAANDWKRPNGSFLLCRCRCDHGAWGCKGRQPATVAQCDSHYQHGTNREAAVSRAGALAAGHLLAAEPHEWGPAVVLD